MLEQPARGASARMSATTEEDLSDGEPPEEVAAPSSSAAAAGAASDPSSTAADDGVSSGMSGAAAPSTAPPPPPPPPVVIKVRTVDDKGRETWFQLKETTKLGKLIDTYCQREGGGKDTGVLNFLFDPTGQGREPHTRGRPRPVCLPR